MAHDTAFTHLDSIRHRVYGRFPVKGGTGHTWLAVGYDFYDVHLEIDLAALARMLGERAINNHSNIASLAGGIIKATAGNRSEDMRFPLGADGRPKIE